MVLKGAIIVVRAYRLGERLRVRVATTMVARTKWLSALRSCRLGKWLRVQVATTMVARTKWLSAKVLE
jgi:hypothetical protein